MKLTFVGFGFIGAILICTIYNNGVQAQVIPDNTLNTSVGGNSNYTITNGSRVGNNLFHSFSQFSVPSNGSAVFNNAADIQNIFSRVTGGYVSNIDGLIQTNGSANLFLLNPAGIIFGVNARLNIGGSFVGTTANSIKFADGIIFSTDTTTSPLLTMSVPVGLQLGMNAGAIRTQGTPASNFVDRPSQMFKAKTVALVGSEIDINQTSLTNRDGRIELWALRNAEVGLNNQAQLQLTSPVAADWGNIFLRQSSIIDTNGINGGAINIRGRGLTLQDGSGISSNTGTLGQGQGINIKTTEFVDLLGVSAASQYPTPGLFTSVVGNQGRAGDITVETQRLHIANAGWIQSTVNAAFDFKNFKLVLSNNSRTGDITIKAADVEVSGYNPFPVNFFRPSAITTLISNGSMNESGKISVVAQRVRLLDGSRISSNLLGFYIPGFSESVTTGKSGDIAIRAAESLEISGVTPAGLIGAVISSIQPYAAGQAGNIIIETGNLSLSQGGTISSAVAGSGIAGNIDIDAKAVEVSDPVIDSFSNTVSGITVALGEDAAGQGGLINLTADSLHVFNGGQITSSSLGQGSAGSVNLRVKNIDVQGISQNLVNSNYLPSAIAASSASSFAAGSVNIQSDIVQVRDDAEITVSNTGSGDAGNLNISAKNIFLKNGANLRSEVNGGSQGNISLDVNEVLLLRHGSKIVTNALGASTGGNININAGFIVGVSNENSDISANAVLGSGGNIQIATQGIYGLKFRNQLTLKSDITASSQFGVNGTVAINNVGIDPNSGLIELPANVTDSSQKIATDCSANNNSSFVATGRGGIPQNPTQEIRSDRTWSDIRDISAFQTTKPVKAQIPKSPEILVQATSWHRNAQGKIELIADKSSVNLPPSLTCAAVNQS
ncbi:S-layer family protein [Nostoc sp. PCC 7107]|uniref:two-partner secretion domain-containing protein n=1 Tax=Nostoc sp. PCC 7107 TaxID=317936 RepID=UPI00029EC5EE|nr:S-layer family protein [Nostoc sp. PCC 7107]AFY45255.1 filamentous hemagglutinin family outer membrane protein [Nostoc sp. PCC 7107]